MASILRMPNVLIYRVDNGGALTGVAPNGTDSEETIDRGRTRIYSACTDGGLISPDSSLDAGFRVERVSFNLTGTTAFNCYVVDPSGLSYPVFSVSAASGYFEWREKGTLVPPGFTFKAVATGTLSAAGGVMFVLADGWKNKTFDSQGILGRSNLPPSQF